MGPKNGPHGDTFGGQRRRIKMNVELWDVRLHPLGAAHGAKKCGEGKRAQAGAQVVWTRQHTAEIESVERKLYSPASRSRLTRQASTFIVSVSPPRLRIDGNKAAPRPIHQ